MRIIIIAKQLKQLGKVYLFNEQAYKLSSFRNERARFSNETITEL